MSTEDEDLFIPPAWIPARSQRWLALEHGKEQGEKARTKKAEAERAAQLQAGALENYGTTAAARGEIVSAMDLATGNAGRTLDDVLDVARAATTSDPPKGQKGVDWDYLDRPEPQLVGRSSPGWPASEFELDRQLERASELHRWGVMYMAEHDYEAAEDAARAKSCGLPMIDR